MQWLSGLVSAVVIFFSGFFGGSQPLPVPSTVQVSLPTQTQGEPTNTQVTNTIATSSQSHSPASTLAVTTQTAPSICSDLMPGSIHQYKGADYYAIEGETVCSLYTGEPISGADPASFVSLSGGAYAKDNAHVYCNDDDGNDVEISGADPNSFQVLLAEKDLGVYGNWSNRYAKDKNAVYYGCSSVSGADPTTFTVLNYDSGTFSGFSKDKNHIYTNIGDQLKVFPADDTTFTLLNDPQGDDSYYAEDKNHIYYGGGISQVDGIIDRSTFKALGWGDCAVGDAPASDGPFAEDGKYVYDNDQIMPNVNPSTFNVNTECISAASATATSASIVSITNAGQKGSAMSGHWVFIAATTSSATIAESTSTNFEYLPTQDSERG